jgi:class 3 adenylate cyclase/tetratricopeptide (TPR) repeat protein
MLASATSGISASELLQRLQAYIPGDRRRTLSRGETIPDRVRGAALFADISGFTPLTEALAGELGAHRGAEELTKHLNRVFQALIDELDRFGGEVICFSGDAITCWFDDDDGARATTCALAMQETMSRVHDVLTPHGNRVSLALKAAVAVGSARRFVVGDPDVQLIDVLAGSLIDALADAEHHAKSGEVILDQSALDALRDRIVVGEVRHDQSSRRYATVFRTLMQVPGLATREHPEALAEDSARRWLLPSLYERLRTGSSEFLTELRPAYPLFARFGGIDYDNDDDAPAKLDAFLRHVQRIFAAYGGNLVHLSVGDKGSYVYGVFGSPHAHEDDAARASAAALELRELPKITAVSALQIGITYGRLRSGMYGHEHRQAFTCLGDAVNLAARLMSSTPPGEIFVSAAVRDSARDQFAWRELEPIQVKGKREPVQAYALTASVKRVHRGEAGTSALPMIGRAVELNLLASSLNAALAGDGSVVGIAAEAGMGKSRLIAAFAEQAAARGIRVATGECQAFGSNMSYFPWREIWHTLLGLDDTLPDGDKAGKVEAELAAIDPALVARAPLLSAVLDIVIGDNDLTASFDAKLRKASLEALLADCLRARADREPLVVVLEDCHWLDQLSRDLLEVLARALPGLRCLFVVAYRPASEPGGGLGLAKLKHFQEIALTELDASQAANLIELKLRQLFGLERDAPAALVDLITSRAQGNPFYIQELLNYIRSRGVDPEDAASLKGLQLPDSLHSLILSRIDAVTEAPRRTLKVASVVGRIFRAPTLEGVYPELGSVSEITDRLATLTAADLVHPEIEAEQSYIFKHAITQEVAYESMPFAFRSALHERVGAFIERTEAGAIDRHLDLLAHHYWHSENVAKKREYLARAGDAAQAAYANAAAIDYFERLAPLIEGENRIDVLLKLGKVVELVGDWKRAEEVDTQALALAVSLDDVKWRASCETALAEVARKQGRFDEALERLERGARGFETAGDESGVGLVKHLAGTVAAQRGDYPKAVENYEASLVIRERIGDKVGMGSLLSNLGIIAEYRGDYEASRRLHERALQLRTDIGDRRGIGNSTTNLGMIAVLQKQFADARDWFRKSMLLNREVGDAWMVALCDHNLANATRGLGEHEAARSHYAASLRAYRSYEDAWALAFLLEDVAMLVAATGNVPAALELLGAADALRDANDMPRAPSRQQEIERELLDFAAGISQHERDACRAQGRASGLHAAVDHALGLCGWPTAATR